MEKWLSGLKQQSTKLSAGDRPEVRILSSPPTLLQTYAESSKSKS